ncbi:MAG: Mor transcription activator family protein [Pseudomonadota bacterium]
MSVPVELLPNSLQEMINVIGLPNTWKIVEKFGGVRLWVPGKFTPSNSLSPVIGHDAARALIERFHNEELSVPRCVEAIRAVRDAAICEAMANGETAASQARHYGLTERAIFKIKARQQAAFNEAQIALL